MNTRPQFDRNSAGISGGTTTTAKAFTSPATGGRVRPGQVARVAGVGAKGGSVRTTRPKATAETKQDLPKTTVPEGPRQTPAITGTIHNTKPTTLVTKQPSTTAGPSNGLRRGTPLIPLRQAHIYGKMGKGLTSMGAHKLPQNKHYGHMRGHGRKPVSSMNVILPPPNAHSATGSMMDSQMFPRTSVLPNHPRPSEFSTFNVEVQPNPTAFKHATPQLDKILNINNNPVMKDDSSKSHITETKEETLIIIEDTLNVTEANNEEKKSATIMSNYPDNQFNYPNNDNPEDSTEENKMAKELCDQILHEEARIATTQQEMFNIEKCSSQREISDLDSTVNPDPASSAMTSTVNEEITNESLKTPEHSAHASKYLENLWRTEFVTTTANDIDIRHPQTAPVTAKPSSSAFREIPGKSTQDNDSEIRPCGTSASYTLLTELAFLQRLKKRAFSKKIDTLYPLKPQTALPLLPVPTLTETDLLKAALKDSCKNLPQTPPPFEQGISEERKPSMTVVYEVDEDEGFVQQNDSKSDLKRSNENT